MIFFLHNFHNTLRNSFLFLIIYLKSDTNGQLSTRCYINDKRDFNFPIIYFPHLDSNIPSAPISDMSVCICIDNKDTYTVKLQRLWIFIDKISDFCGTNQNSNELHYFESFAVATMTWLTVMEYMCHKWPRICSTRRKHFPVLSSFMTCHWVCN